VSFLGRRFTSFVWVGLPIIAAAGLFFGLRDAPAAWQAHRGEGVAGTFVATSARCKVSSDTCSTVYGDFTAADGSVKRTDVVLYEAPKALADGGETAAQDTGAPHGVFLPDGGSSYVMYTVFLAGGALAAIAWLLFLVSRFRRRKAATLEPV
jgi:hypothetical protein